MCILIVKKQGVNAPTKQTLKKCFESNPDGAGFAYRKDGKIFLIKGLMTFADFWEAFSRVKNIKQYDSLLHFRIATHGTVCAENTHPFQLVDGIVGAHNGILPIKSENNKTDTQIFFDSICSPLISKFGYTSDLFSNVVNLSIGTSKVAFLHANKGLLHFGHFIDDEGVLYSNTSYIVYKNYKFTNNIPAISRIDSDNKWNKKYWNNDDNCFDY